MYRESENRQVSSKTVLATLWNWSIVKESKYFERKNDLVAAVRIYSWAESSQPQNKIVTTLHTTSWVWNAVRINAVWVSSRIARDHSNRLFASNHSHRYRSLRSGYVTRWCHNRWIGIWIECRLTKVALRARREMGPFGCGDSSQIERVLSGIGGLAIDVAHIFIQTESFRTKIPWSRLYNILINKNYQIKLLK